MFLSKVKAKLKRRCLFADSFAPKTWIMQFQKASQTVNLMRHASTEYGRNTLPRNAMNNENSASCLSAVGSFALTSIENNDWSCLISDVYVKRGTYCAARPPRNLQIKFSRNSLKNRAENFLFEVWTRKNKLSLFLYADFLRILQSLRDLRRVMFTTLHVVVTTLYCFVNTNEFAWMLMVSR